MAKNTFTGTLVKKVGQSRGGVYFGSVQLAGVDNTVTASFNSQSAYQAAQEGTEVTVSITHGLGVSARIELSSTATP